MLEERKMHNAKTVASNSTGIIFLHAELISYPPMSTSYCTYNYRPLESANCIPLRYTSDGTLRHPKTVTIPKGHASAPRMVRPAVSNAAAERKSVIPTNARSHIQKFACRLQCYDLNPDSVSLSLATTEKSLVAENVDIQCNAKAMLRRVGHPETRTGVMLPHLG